MGEVLSYWKENSESKVQQVLEGSRNNLPKYFADVVEENPDPHYADYKNAEIEFGLQDDYEFCGKLGRGRYSEVYKAVNLLNE